MNRLQRYSSGIRSVNRFRQHEQFRPKYFSIYNFNESGKETGRVEPLHAIRFYKNKTREENRWQMRTETIRSPKWSWITANHYERVNTYLQNRNIMKNYKDYVLTKRLDAACTENGVGSLALVKGLKTAGSKLDLEMLEKLAIYEPNTFAALCDLVRRSKHDLRWDQIKERQPDLCRGQVPEGKRVTFNTVTDGMKRLHE